MERHLLRLLFTAPVPVNKRWKMVFTEMLQQPEQTSICRARVNHVKPPGLTNVVIKYLCTQLLHVHADFTSSKRKDIPFLKSLNRNDYQHLDPFIIIVFFFIVHHHKYSFFFFFLQMIFSTHDHLSHGNLFKSLHNLFSKMYTYGSDI